MSPRFPGGLIDFIASPRILEAILVNLAVLGLSAIYRKVALTLSTRNPRYRPASLAGLVALWAAVNYAFFGNSSILIISSLVIIWVICQELKQFWQIGLQSADRQIRTGIDYRRALRLCHSSLEFLGVGAAKLTVQRPDFDEAIHRCHHEERPIRLLLCDPENEKLRTFAKQAGVQEGEYQRRVVDSLRVIRELRQIRARNIEVRFYTGQTMPIFRLMFINDSICLASHYRFGEGDGSDLPQLHIRRARGAAPEASSLYYPLQIYFSRLWDDATPWDFHSKLDV